MPKLLHPIPPLPPRQPGEDMLSWMTDTVDKLRMKSNSPENILLPGKYAFYQRFDDMVYCYTFQTLEEMQAFRMAESLARKVMK